MREPRFPRVRPSDAVLGAILDAQALAWIRTDSPLGPTHCAARAARVIDAEPDGIRIRLTACGTEHVVTPVTASWTLRDLPADIIVAEVPW